MSAALYLHDHTPLLQPLRLCPQACLFGLRPISGPLRRAGVGGLGWGAAVLGRADLGCQPGCTIHSSGAGVVRILGVSHVWLAQSCHPIHAPPSLLSSPLILFSHCLPPTFILLANLLDILRWQSPQEETEA